MPNLDDQNGRIATRLRLARVRAGLSQGQVARMLGLHRPTITELESGGRRLSAAELAQFSKIYNVDVAWLACAEGTSEPLDSDRLQIAAREIAKLKKEDFDLVVDLLTSLRKRENKRG